MKMLGEKLDELEMNGQIKSWKIIENTTPDHMNESETLILVFPSGQELKISTCCSGVLENTSFFLEE